MARRTAAALATMLLSAVALAGPAAAADLSRAPAGRPGRFLATCEDLGGLCFADACGRDQIEAAQACRAQCPSAAVMSVLPAVCGAAPPRPVVLRRRG